MRSMAVLVLVATAMPLASLTFAASPTRGVQVVADEAHRRVDITIDGQPFTSYIWPASLKKPVLYPLVSDDGITITRGFPLKPQPGERVDYPHHAGLWFNYGNANGFDFWNNSDAIKPESRAKMGTVEFGKILSTRSGSDAGELVVESTWITGENQPILDQTTRYILSRRKQARVIDQVVTLKALDRAFSMTTRKGCSECVSSTGLNRPMKRAVFLWTPAEDRQR